MNSNIVLVILIALLAPISGCLTDAIDDKGMMIDERGVEVPTERVLTIVTYDIYGLTSERIMEFTNQTGIKVEMIKLGDAGAILNHLLQTKEAPQADLALGLDNTYLQQAIDRNVIQSHGANISNVMESAWLPYNGTMAVPFDQGSICLNYDINSINSSQGKELPTSLWNLSEEAWKGKVAIPSPVTSSPGRAFMIATTDYFANDDDETTNWTDWWSAMVDNDVIITSGWTEAYETHYSGGYGVWNDDHIGDANFVVSYCHSPGVEAYWADNYTISASLVLDRASFHQVEYATVVNGTTNAEYADLFIEYLLTEDINLNMPIENSMYSVLIDSELPADNGYLYHSELPSLNAQVSPEEIAENMDSWLAAWEAAMV
jgi:thiamine transport system substrate-binding protein